MKIDVGGLLAKANAYKQVKNNTIDYRKAWHEEKKPMIISTLEEIKSQLDLKAKIDCRDNIENLEAIVFDLGKASSGISENLENTDIKRMMIKFNGALIYQQLFNGKIMIMVSSPYIEGYGEPKPPRMIEILRPDELKQPFILRHMEALLKDITEWEDYDDDEPTKNQVGFNPIGFNQAPIED